MQFAGCEYIFFLFFWFIECKFYIYTFQSYKQSWKSTNNHFQRYSDVKPREERRSTVVDLANQAQVLQKVNGWKIYHLTSQMEDLVSVAIGNISAFIQTNPSYNFFCILFWVCMQSELESQVYDKLASMLQCMEAHEQNSDVDRVNELIKVNFVLRFSQKL